MIILLAEDEIITLEAVELRLKKDGHTVICFTNGRDALEKLDEVQPDLIITDIMMPFSSGLEIIKTVMCKGGKTIPIIVLSAMGQERTVLEAFQLGADDFMTKPFSLKELSVRVKKYATDPGGS